MPDAWLTVWLPVSVNDSHPMRCLSRVVHHLRAAVTELVGLHDSHLGPVSVVDGALKQADGKGVWNDGASMHHCFSGRRTQGTRIKHVKNTLTRQGCVSQNHTR